MYTCIAYIFFTISQCLIIDNTIVHNVRIINKSVKNMTKIKKKIDSSNYTNPIIFPFRSHISDV